MVQLEGVAQRKPQQLSGDSSAACGYRSRGGRINLACYYWMNRFPRWTINCATNAERELKALQRKLGITFVLSPRSGRSASCPIVAVR